LTYVSKGQLIARRWPTDTASRQTPLRKQQNEKLGQAIRLAKLQPAEIVNGLITSKWRKSYFLYDWLVSAAYGNAWAISAPGERTFWPVSVANEISGNLDVLEPTPGAMLFRGEQRWNGIPPGTAGQVLAMAPGNLSQVWVKGQGPALIAEALAASNVIDIQGLDFDPWRMVDIDLHSLQVSVDAAAVNLQLYIDGTLITSGYKYCGQEQSTGGASSVFNSTSAASIPICSNIGNASNKGGQSKIFIGAPTSLLNKVLQFHSVFNYNTSNSANRVGSAILENGGKITGFRLTASSGNIITGRLRLFGSPFPAL